MRNVYLAIIGVLLTACGPSWHIQQAKKHILKAEAKGVQWQRDTVWRKINFHIEGPKFETKLLDPEHGEPIYYRGKDSVQLEIRRIPGPPGKRDTLYIIGDCPDVDIEKEVPVAVNNKLESGYGLWEMIILAIVCLIAGYFSRIVVKSFQKG